MKCKRKQNFDGVVYFKLNAVLQNNGIYLFIIFLHQPSSVRDAISRSTSN
jgi:hypothetical protein